MDKTCIKVQIDDELEASIGRMMAAEGEGLSVCVRKLLRQDLRRRGFMAPGGEPVARRGARDTDPEQ